MKWYEAREGMRVRHIAGTRRGVVVEVLPTQRLIKVRFLDSWHQHPEIVRPADYALDNLPPPGTVPRDEPP